MRDISRALGAAALLCALLAPGAARAQPDPSLVGHWVVQSERGTMALALEADGTGSLDVTMPHGVKRETGHWTRPDAIHIVLAWESGASSRYEIMLRNGTLTLSGGDLETPLLLTRAPAAPGGPPAAPPAAAVSGPIIGRWVHEDPNAKTFIAFIPDGRCGVRNVVFGVPQAVFGKYTLAGDRLTLELAGAPARTVTIAIAGDRMTVRDGIDPNPRVYEKEPGSETTVVEEARAADAAKARDDEAWRQRLPVCKLDHTAPSPARNGPPGDVNWQKVFEGATVFQADQVYGWMSMIEYTYPPGDPRAGQIAHSSSTTYLHANGRVFSTSTNRAGSVKPPDVPQPVTGLYYVAAEHTAAFWGRYRIDADETVHVEFDDGSGGDCRLADGRRNLVTEHLTLANSIWENQQVQDALRAGGEGR